MEPESAQTPAPIPGAPRSSLWPGRRVEGLEDLVLSESPHDKLTWLWCHRSWHLGLKRPPRLTLKLCPLPVTRPQRRGSKLSQKIRPKVGALSASLTGHCLVAAGGPVSGTGAQGSERDAKLKCLQEQQVGKCGGLPWINSLRHKFRSFFSPLLRCPGDMTDVVWV